MDAKTNNLPSKWYCYVPDIFLNFEIVFSGLQEKFRTAPLWLNNAVELLSSSKRYLVYSFEDNIVLLFVTASLAFYYKNKPEHQDIFFQHFAEMSTILECIFPQLEQSRYTITQLNALVGSLYFNLESYTEAEKYYKKIINLGFADAQIFQQCESLFNLCECYYQNGLLNFEEGCVLYKKKQRTEAGIFFKKAQTNYIQTINLTNQMLFYFTSYKNDLKLMQIKATYHLSVFYCKCEFPNFKDFNRSAEYFINILFFALKELKYNVDPNHQTSLLTYINNSCQYLCFLTKEKVIDETLIQQNIGLLAQVHSSVKLSQEAFDNLSDVLELFSPRMRPR